MEGEESALPGEGVLGGGERGRGRRSARSTTSCEQGASYSMRDICHGEDQTKIGLANHTSSSNYNTYDRVPIIPALRFDPFKLRQCL